MTNRSFLVSACSLLGICLLANNLQAKIIPRLQSGENLTITAIGTSLTAGGAWLGQMANWMNTTFPGQVTVHNCGIGASASQNTSTYTAPTSGLGVQLGNALATNPDAIFIEFAMNDAYAPYGISQQASRENLQTMINLINIWASDNKKKVDIIIQTMNNAADINGYAEGSARPQLADYYGGYRSVAAANHLLLIDHYPNWMNLYNSESNHATWLSYTDVYGVHPNVSGTQQVVLPTIQGALMSEAPEPQSAILAAIGLLLLAAYGWRRRT